MISQHSQLVSIGLPTFNRVATLKRALDSLLAQTYNNFELIISDNASTDDTEKICLEYSQKDDRVKYFRQEKNIGMIRQFDFLVTNIKGNFFMLASDDDWWHPNFISILKEVLDKHPQYGIAMSSLRQVHEDGSLMNEVIYDGLNNLSTFSHSRVFDAVVWKNPPAHFFILGLYRIEILKKLFWEPAPIVLGGDKIIMYEAALFTRFYSVPDVLWVRTSSFVPDAQRYTGEYKKIFIDKWAYIKHIKVSISRLFRSPNISLARKFYLLPIKIIVLFYAYRKHLIREMFPNVFQIFKRMSRSGN